MRSAPLVLTVVLTVVVVVAPVDTSVSGTLALTGVDVLCCINELLGALVALLAAPPSVSPDSLFD